MKEWWTMKDDTFGYSHIISSEVGLQMEEVGKLAKKTGNLHCLVLEQMDIAPQGKRKGPEEAREGRNEPGHCRVWLYGVWRTGPAAVMTTIHKPSPYTQAQDSIFFFKLIFFLKQNPT